MGLKDHYSCPGKRLWPDKRRLSRDENRTSIQLGGVGMVRRNESKMIAMVFDSSDLS